MAKATPQTKTINLALQGGGAHGAFTWGVLDYLLEDGRIKLDGLSGTSAGAVNSVLLAYGLQVGGHDGARAKLDEFWKAMSEAGTSPFGDMMEPWKKMIGASFGGTGPMVAATYNALDTLTRTMSPYELNPFDFNPLRDLLEKCVDFERLRCCTDVKLFINATNVKTGKARIFETSDISLDAVMASACLPSLYKAVEIDGEAYWDGGFIGNPALFPFFYKCESRDVLIVHINPMRRESIPKTAPEIMNRLNEISFNSSLISELRAIKFASKLVQEHWLKDEYHNNIRDVYVHSIHSDDALDDLSVATKYDISWPFLTDLRDRGRGVAKEWCQTHFEAVGKHSSVDLDAEFLNISNIHS
ncbi:patatin-like phospholipase family protein [Lentilitoribacter sp. EG35]|uniref:patatin-like phospholipase family protein n=1 Tax=Lentilitoribacter sp. EG35 TaxID=3234192 RepID=UPI003460C0E4